MAFAAPDEVLLIGGPDRQVFRYSPQTLEWLPHSIAALARQYHAAVRLQNNNILVCGGVTSQGGVTIPLTSCEIWSPVNGVWNPTSAMNIQRGNPASGPPQLVLLSSGKVLSLFGNQTIATAVEIFDPSTNVWTGAGSLSTGRTPGGRATSLANGKVLVCGGIGSSTVLASCELYDPALNNWALTSSMSTARANHAALLLLNGHVLVVGGDSGAAPFIGEMYDPAVGTWSPTQPLAVGPRLYPGLMYLSGFPCVVGGRLITNTTASIECLALSSSLWQATSLVLPVSLENFPAVTLPDTGAPLIGGGLSFSTTLGGEGVQTQTLVSNAQQSEFSVGGTIPWRLAPWVLVVAPSAPGTCDADTSPAGSVDHSDCNRVLTATHTCVDECSSGYEPASGSPTGTRTCQVGGLSTSGLNCTPVACPTVQLSTSAISSCDSLGPNISSGENCSESCGAGYRQISASDSGNRLCTLGILAPRTLSCIQTCPPDNSTNSNGLSHTNCNTLLDEGQSCIDECSDGYGSPNGTATRLCSGGVLNASLLTCSPLSCPQPDPTPGIITCNGSTAPGSYCNETCNFTTHLQTCPSGYSGVSRLCTLGTLDPRALICSLFCPPPVPPPGVATCDFPTTDGAICHEECAPGYRQTSSGVGQSRTCTSGSLSTRTLTCIQTCPADDSAESQGVTHVDCNRTLDENATCQDACSVGYVFLSGTGDRTCSGGVLNRSTLVCRLATCTVPTPSEGIVTCTDAQEEGGIASGANCHETCASDFTQTSGGGSGADRFCSEVGVLGARSLTCTRLILSASHLLSQYGQSVLFTAILDVSDQLPVSAGQVTFHTLVGSSPQSLGTASLISGVANVTYSAFLLSVDGPYQIVATYQNVTSNVVALVVSQAQSQTLLTSSSNPAEFTEDITFTIQAQSVFPPNSALTALPTGTILLLTDNGQFLSSTLLPLTPASATATYTTATLTKATHPIQAMYLGDKNYLPSNVTLQQSVITVVPIFATYTSKIATKNIGQLNLKFPIPIPPPLKITTTITPTSPGFTYPTNLIFTGTNFAFAPQLSSGGITGTSILASQKVTFTFSSLPSSIPTPIYIYASNWPADRFSFSTTVIQRSPAKSSKVSITTSAGKSTLVVNTGPFSGILEVSGPLSSGSKSFSWQGTKATKLSYTLATGGGSH